MKIWNRIIIGIVCLMLFLSTMTIPQSVSETAMEGSSGFVITGGRTIFATLYGYIHLDDGTGVTELTDHSLRVTNCRTQYTQETLTNQYGFYSLEPYNVFITDVLTLDVSYYDPETSANIYGSTTITVSDYMRADPTFVLSAQECEWYLDNDAPPSVPPPHPDL
jgi:hypothetical protein